MGSISHFLSLSLSLSLSFSPSLTFSLSKSCSLSLSLFGVNGNAHLNNLLGLGLCARYFFKWRNNNSLSGSTRRLSAFQWFTIMKSSTESETLGLGIAVAPEKVLRSLKWFLFRQKNRFHYFFGETETETKEVLEWRLWTNVFLSFEKVGSDAPAAVLFYLTFIA